MFQLSITADSPRELLHKLESLYLDMTREADAPKRIVDITAETPRRRFRVLLSPYPDINNGDVGEMMDEVGGDCIALRFEKLFTSANNLEVRTMQKRVIAFERKHLEEITSAES